MNSQCKKIHFLFENYLNSTLSVKEMKTVKDHLKSCSDCRRELIRESKIIKSIKEMPLIECPENIIQQIEAETFRKKRTLLFPGQIFSWSGSGSLKNLSLGFAAAIVLVLVIFKPFNIIKKQPLPENSMFTENEIKEAKNKAKISLAYIGSILNKSEKMIIDDVLLDNFPKIIKNNIKKSIPILGGK